MSAETARAPECPKCSARRSPDAEACARCGLTFALWNPAPDAPPPAQLDERGEALWGEALAAWETGDKHEAFLRHCAMSGALAIAGRRYRERLDRQPNDAMAGRMQSRVLGMATAAFVRPTAAPLPVTRNLWFWLVLVACAVVGMVGAFLLRR
jgi:hypothetical protein